MCNRVICNTLLSRKNARHFPDAIFKCIFFNENVWISIMVSLKFIPKGPNNNIPALGQRMAWRRSGDKPLSEPMMVSLLTHICITWPQTFKVQYDFINLIFIIGDLLCGFAILCCISQSFICVLNCICRLNYLNCSSHHTYIQTCFKCIIHFLSSIATYGHLHYDE